MKTTLLAGIASLALVIPALAQTSTAPGQSQTTTPSMTQTTPPVTQTTPSVTQSQTSSTMTYMNALMPGQFMASNLMDRTVYGSDGNSLGDINDVIIDRNGNIAAVVIGVGGFLGIGEKDVAVPFNRLQVMAREQARTPGATTTTPGTTNTAPGTSGMAGSTSTSTGTTGMSGSDGFWASFTDESRLVLSATRDELRNAPTFRENTRGGTARTGTDGTATRPNTTAPSGTPTR